MYHSIILEQLIMTYRFLENGLEKFSGSQCFSANLLFVVITLSSIVWISDIFCECFGLYTFEREVGIFPSPWHWFILLFSLFKHLGNHFCFPVIYTLSNSSLNAWPRESRKLPLHIICLMIFMPLHNFLALSVVAAMFGTSIGKALYFVDDVMANPSCRLIFFFF